MGMKQYLFNYIAERYEHLKSVESFKVNDCDSDEGAIGDNYIVECVIRVKDYAFPSPTWLEKPATCLVNVVQFKSWLAKEQAIKWITKY